MQGVGYNASEQDSLPVLFKEVYGFKLKGCADCKEKAFKALVAWARKEIKPKVSDMPLRIKPEFIHKEFVFRHQGKVVVVTADNLTPERAGWMLAHPGYSHAIEGNPDFVETEKEPQDNTTQSEMFTEKKDTEATDPNVSEAVTVSTSTNQNTDGKQQVHLVGKKLSPLPASEVSKAKKEANRKGK